MPRKNGNTQRPTKAARRRAARLRARREPKSSVQPVERHTVPVALFVGIGDPSRRAVKS